MSADPSLELALARAEAIARTRHAEQVTTSHLLLGLLSDGRSRWPAVVAERGGLTYAIAAKRLGSPRPRDADVPAANDHLPSVRMSLTARLSAVLALGERFMRWWREPTAPVPTSAVRQALAVAERLRYAPRRSRPLSSAQELATGHLLLALCLMPGRHLRLLDNASLTASAVRRELGLARDFDLLMLKLDGGRVRLRRAGATLRARRGRDGLVSGWSAAYFAFRALGAFWLSSVVMLVLAPTVGLYLFLWPAVLLVAGLRALVGLVTRCDLRMTKWYEIPGGEAGLRDGAAPVSSTRLAITVLTPRAIAFGCCVAAVTAMLWRGIAIGVNPFPTLFTRPDLFVNEDPIGFLHLPARLTEQFFMQYDPPYALGLLAGFGAGVLCLPTYRELEMLRTYAGHELGGGSAAGRATLMPAVGITHLMALVEAVLPFRGGPVYVTVYVLPLSAAVFAAWEIVSVMTY